MAVWGRSLLLAILPLWMNFGTVAALAEPEICYILDGILFTYGIILTALYFRIKFLQYKDNQAAAKTNGEGIYMDLNPHDPDTYETIGTKKGNENK